MNLLPDEVRKTLPVLYSTQEEADPVARVKFFTPWSNWTWFITEFDGDDLCFGLVDGHEREFGYFSLREIAQVRGPGGLRIERDLWFTAKPASECAPRQTAQTFMVWAVFAGEAGSTEGTASSLLGDEILQGLVVQTGEAQQLDDVNAALPSLALAHHALREAQVLGSLHLSQARFLPSLT